MVSHKTDFLAIQDVQRLWLIFNKVHDSKFMTHPYTSTENCPHHWKHPRLKVCQALREHRLQPSGRLLVFVYHVKHMARSLQGTLCYFLAAWNYNTKNSVLCSNFISRGEAINLAQCLKSKRERLTRGSTRLDLLPLVTLWNSFWGLGIEREPITLPANPPLAVFVAAMFSWNIVQ